MSKGGSWWTKSLLIGVAAGLAALGLAYGFLTIHQELGLSARVSFALALLAFAFTTIAAAIYFRVRAGR